MAEEREEQKDGEESAAAGSQETAVGHSVVEEPARETAVGHPVVDAEADAGVQAGSDTTEVFFSKDEPAAEQTQPAAAPPREPSGTSPAAADRQASDDQDQFAAKPELYVAGAFVGAFVFAKLLKKLTGSDD
jgi:hypothetical protein